MSITAAPTWRLGLTGGIGSGKSTVARLLQDRGAVVIDADAISRACTASGGAAMETIAQVFGADFLTPDGAMDRQHMREHVFAQPPARQALEAIIHPLVAAEIARQAAAARTPCLVFDIPLLVESPRWRVQLDRILVVDCLIESQVRRVTERSGWDPENTLAVINSQSPRNHRLCASDLVIYNEGSLKDLQVLIEQMAHRFGL